MITKKVKIMLIIAIIGVMVATTFFYLQNSQKKYHFQPFPPEPTQEEIENAKKLPRGSCTCWMGGDDANAYCAPQQSCI